MNSLCPHLYAKHNTFLLTNSLSVPHQAPVRQRSAFCLPYLQRRAHRYFSCPIHQYRITPESGTAVPPSGVTDGKKRQKENGVAALCPKKENGSQHCVRIRRSGNLRVPKTGRGTISTVLISIGITSTGVICSRL